MDETGLKRAALLVATFASFLTPFMGAALNVALPAIGEEFHANAIELNWIATAYILATAVFLLPAGRIADIIGRKRVFTWGIVLFLISSVFCAIATNVEFLIMARVFQGAGSAMIFGTGVAILSSVFEAGERGRALGINVAAVYIGLATGPFGGGMITEYLGWRAIFWTTIPIGMAAIAMIFWKLKTEWADSRGESFDLVGFLLYGSALVLIMTGFSELPETPGYLFLGVGIILVIMFVFFEKRSRFPLVDISLLQNNRAFAFSNLAALINYSATFAVGFLMSLYLQYIKNFDPGLAGLVLVSQPIMMALFSPLAGKLSDRVEPRIIASAGMALSTVGLFFLIFLSEKTPLWWIIVLLILLGLGFALFSSPNTNAIMSSVNRKHFGVASGMVGTMRMVGQMISMATALLTFAIMIGRVEIQPRYYGQFVKSLNISFAIFTLLCFLGIFASLARGRLREG